MNCQQLSEWIIGKANCSYQDVQQHLRDCAKCKQGADSNMQAWPILPLYQPFKMPCRAESGSVGYDIYPPGYGVILPKSRQLIKLGFKAAIKPGYVGLLLDRSGMANKGMTRMGGVIDPSYRGEWGAIIYNTTDTPFEYDNSKALIQCVFVRAELPIPYIVDHLDETDRGEGGFGSTDK